MYRSLLPILLCITLCGCRNAPSTLNVALLEPQIDSIAEVAIAGGAFPGCQFVISQNGKVLLDKCYGLHSSERPIAVRSTDLYDLASVTKTTATLPGIMRLYEQGVVDLDAKVADYLDFYRGSVWEEVTVHDLLMHESGLPSTIPFYYSAIDPASYREPLLSRSRDADHPLQLESELFISRFRYRDGAFTSEPDTRHTLEVYRDMWLDEAYIDTLKAAIVNYPFSPKHYQYSDIGFISLQWIVEKLTGKPMAEYLEEEFYKPMGALRTAFVPARCFPLEQIVPTVNDDALRGVDEICGYTQDEVAAFMGGTAGEAGLFSTASDLVRIYQMYLNGGTLDGRRYFKRSTIERFTTERSTISHRGLGFDRPNLLHPDESPCVADAPAESYGHSGFSGPNVWVDPVNGLVYAMVCNRVSPYPWNNRLNEMGVFGAMQQAIYSSLER